MSTAFCKRVAALKVSAADSKQPSDVRRRATSVRPLVRRTRRNTQRVARFYAAATTTAMTAAAIKRRTEFFWRAFFASSDKRL